MKPMTRLLLFAAVALAATSVTEWTQEKVHESEQMARNCEQAKPFTQGKHAGAPEEQQHAMLKTAECAYGSLNPAAAAIMKEQGTDPNKMLDVFKQLDTMSREK